MASLLDISLLNSFSDIFVILFVFTIVYAVLMMKFPEAKAMNALLAFSGSIMFIFSQDALEIVKSTVPWFIILMVVLTMMVVVTHSYGGAALPPVVQGNMGMWIFIVGLIILIINISFNIGDDVGPFVGNNSDPNNVVAGGPGDVGTGDFQNNFGATIFHPKVLGMLLVLLVVMFSIWLIGYTYT